MNTKEGTQYCNLRAEPWCRSKLQVSLENAIDLCALPPENPETTVKSLGKDECMVDLDMLGTQAALQNSSYSNGGMGATQQFPELYRNKQKKNDLNGSCTQE